MSIPNKGLFSLCIPLLAIVLIFNGCENPGSVGGEYVDRPTVTFDTLNITSSEELSLNGYSGALTFVPIGKYSDAIFGEVTTSGFFRPSLTPVIPDSIDIAESFQLKLSLSLDSLEAYGDTLSESNFTVYEITSEWRGKTLRIDDELQFSNQVGSFTIGQEKLVTVDLDPQWVDKYKSYYFENEDDSAYVSELKGLAIISDDNNSKISFIRSDRSNFLLINGINSDTTDTVRFGSGKFDKGYTLERTGATNTPNTFALHTTLEGLNKFSFPDSLLRANNSSNNIVRANLVFYEAGEELTQSLPANHQRLDVSLLKLHPVTNFEPVYEYQFVPTNLPVFKRENEPIFEVDVTNSINNVIFGNSERDGYVLGIGSNSGTIRSTLIYGVTAPENVRPKLIITSLVD